MTDPQEQEVPLPGGDVTEAVVRVGDTVRRPVGPHSVLVHTVLKHLEDAEVDLAPRFVGIDDEVVLFAARDVYRDDFLTQALLSRSGFLL